MKYILTALLLLSGIITQAQKNWWDNTVAYEIFVRSFYDTNADGRGDFNGITAKLDYLNAINSNDDLGVGLIWLMPINPSPSYHGYDVTNYKTVNPQYGSINDFKNFVDAAHARNIRVIIDLVINHTSTQHPWFIKSAANDPFYRNFYRWENNPPNQQGPWGQQVWYPRNGSNYYALFWSGMPDLNFNYAPVRDSIFDIAKFWIKEMNVDGFRLDAAMYLYEEGNTLKNHPNTINFWKALNDSCEVWKANTLLLGEVWDAPEVVQLYNGALDVCFDFNLADKNLQSINSSNPQDARIALKSTQEIYPNNQFASFLTNHDINRVFDVLGNNTDKAKAAASLLLTQPGLPFLYYGEEVGMKGVKPDEDIRRPMQWSNATHAGFTTGTPWRALNSNYATYNVSVMQNDANSLWHHYKKLIDIRLSDSTLMNGNSKNIISSNNVVHSFSRSYKKQDIIVLQNTSSTNVDDLFFQYIKSDSSTENFLIKDLLSDSLFFVSANNYKYNFNIDIPAYGTKILKFVEALDASLTHRHKEFEVYPNPVSDKLFLRDVHLKLGEVIEVWDLQGKQILRLEGMGRESIDVSMLQQGLYLLKIGAEYRKFLKN